MKSRTAALLALPGVLATALLAIPLLIDAATDLVAGRPVHTDALAAS